MGKGPDRGVNVRPLSVRSEQKPVEARPGSRPKIASTQESGISFGRPPLDHSETHELALAQVSRHSFGNLTPRKSSEKVIRRVISLAPLALIT